VSAPNVISDVSREGNEIIINQSIDIDTIPDLISFLDALVDSDCGKSITIERSKKKYIITVKD
jgi:hypothetical protein